MIPCTWPSFPAGTSLMTHFVLLCSPMGKGTDSPYDKTTIARNRRFLNTPRIAGVIKFPTNSSPGLHSTTTETWSCLTSTAKASCFSPAQNKCGALVCYSTRRFGGIFPNGSCCGSAVICQPHFCIYPIPLDTSAFRICFEYVRSYGFFPLLTIPFVC